MSKELERVIELLHSNEHLSEADQTLIRTHWEEVRDHLPAHIKVIVDSIEATGPIRPMQPPSSRINLEEQMADVEENNIRILIELGRFQRIIDKSKNPRGCH